MQQLAWEHLYCDIPHLCWMIPLQSCPRSQHCVQYLNWQRYDLEGCVIDVNYSLVGFQQRWHRWIWWNIPHFTKFQLLSSLLIAPCWNLIALQSTMLCDYPKLIFIGWRTISPWDIWWYHASPLQDDSRSQCATVIWIDIDDMILDDVWLFQFTTFWVSTAVLLIWWNIPYFTKLQQLSSCWSILAKYVDAMF